MNEEDIKKLIDRYYEGRSTDEDERLLRAYFTRPDLPREYESEQRIFGYFAENLNIPEPSSGFEARISKSLGNVQDDEGTLKVRKIVISVFGMAAGILLLLGSYFLLTRDRGIRDTYDDPDIAYAETMKVLVEVSAKLNQATRALQPVAMINEMQVKSFETINESAEIIERNLSSLRYLKKVNGSNDTITNHD